LRIWRGLTPQAGQFENHEVPFEPGQSVLDGLRWPVAVAASRFGA